MKIALNQMQVIPGNRQQNLQTMLNSIKQARDNGVDLLVFPELCVWLYVGRLVAVARFCRRTARIQHHHSRSQPEYRHRLWQCHRRLHLPTRLATNNHHPNKDGRIRLYNAACIVQNGKWLNRKQEHAFLPQGIQPKTLLPNYRFFDDERYFFSLQDVATDMNAPLQQLAQPFELTVKGQTHYVGLQVCEDLWCKDYRRDHQALNMSRYLIENGADFIVNISASPWTNKSTTRATGAFNSLPTI